MVERSSLTMGGVVSSVMMGGGGSSSVIGEGGSSAVMVGGSLASMGGVGFSMTGGCGSSLLVRNMSEILLMRACLTSKGKTCRWITGTFNATVDPFHLKFLSRLWNLGL